MKKFSLIIPAYNVEDYLDDCLDSITRQTLPPYEIILINDGSSDNTLHIAEKHAKTNNLIKICTTSNQGQSKARNHGIDNSSGDYLVFIDSDDYLETNALEWLSEQANTNEADIIFYSANTFLDQGSQGLTTKGFKYKRSNTHKALETTSGMYFKNSIENNNYVVSPCLFAAKKSAIGKIRFYPGIYHEDNLFTTRLLIENCKLRISYSDLKLYNRRIRENSIMTQRKVTKHAEGYIVVTEELLKIRNTGIDQDVSKSLDNFISKTLIRASSALSECQRTPETTDIKKRIVYAYSKIRNRTFHLIIAVKFPFLFSLKKALSRILKCLSIKN